MIPEPPSARRPLPAALLTFVALAAGGCLSADEYRVQADDEVYAIIAERRAEFVADPEAFTIDPDGESLAWRYMSGEIPLSEPLGPIGLVECIRLSAATDTEVQSRKESLYLTALDLTFARYLFGVQPNAGASATLTGQNEGLEATSAAASVSAGFSRVLGSGAQIVGNVGLSIFRGLLSSEDWDPASSIGFSITQPLLSGFGSAITLEPLTQAERNVVYEVRSFERFRRTFAFSIASDYFRVLQAYDTLENAEANLASLVLLSERNVALAESGRLSDTQVDQARQDRLRAETSVIDSRQTLEGLLDNFKDRLGLPLEVELSLDRTELERVVESGIEDLGHTADEVIELALTRRFDYRNAVDRIQDSERDVMIAADDLRGSLGLDIDVNATSQPGQPLAYDKQGFFWSVGLDLDLPIDRLSERNSYRGALVSLQAAERSAADLAISIELSLRASLRELVSRKQAYEIQKNSVALAERRVDSTTLNFEAGRVETRDLLEARDDLVVARDALTRALVDYHLATLALYRDIEALVVDEDSLRPDDEALEALTENDE
ncbi:TolC family protein [Engelhardtia mirabilis]|uniref:Outer membrane efflux protein n=1 Tax=Engelhardtia mirabilis TaxID=2528011 RepID=A0A518BP53_9BACT|nr:Outer membrane efflux protein [Planctomycetes bacterium Pla133]QDV03087.1 Outer membrane efflux protein [Planctomycetes bacterium Pla86]